MKKYWKRHYTASIHWNYLMPGYSLDNLMDIGFDDLTPSGSIEINENEIGKPLPMDELHMGKFFCDLDFWRYEEDEYETEEAYEEGDFETRRWCNGDAVVVYDGDEWGYVLKEKNPDFGGADFKQIAYEILAEKYLDEVMEQARDEARFGDLDLATEEGARKAIRYMDHFIEGDDLDEVFYQPDYPRAYLYNFKEAVRDAYNDALVQLIVDTARKEAK